ncbi:hypothetical protein [Chryseobacterium sp. A321]
MALQTNQSPINSKQGKDTKYKAQLQRVVLSLQKQPLTMLQVARKTGIERASICRRVAQLRKTNSIYLVKTGLCPITKHRAGFYTTNRDIFLQSLNNQQND